MSGTGTRRGTKKTWGISCTARQWERIRELARREEMTMQDYLIERSLNVDLPDEPSHPLVLDESEQQEIRDTIKRFAGYMGSAPDRKVMTYLEEAVTLLNTIMMMHMTETGGSEDLEVLLVRRFGERSAERILRQFHQCTGNPAPPQ